MPAKIHSISLKYLPFIKFWKPISCSIILEKYGQQNRDEYTKQILQQTNKYQDNKWGQIRGKIHFWEYIYIYIYLFQLKLPVSGFSRQSKNVH